MITMIIKDLGQMEFEMVREEAPNTVANFVELARKGFYDGLTFHRIIKGFMIQGGDPKGIGIGGPGYGIKGEFKSNGVNNNLKHTRGILSMARSSLPNSAGSQFFIMHKDAPYLDGEYAAFGTMKSGFEVLDKIASVRTDHNDRPLERVVIEKVIVTDEPEVEVEKVSE